MTQSKKTLSLQASDIFNAHHNAWKEWSCMNGVIAWVDRKGKTHKAKTVNQLELSLIEQA